MYYEREYGGKSNQCRQPANLPRQVKNIHYTPVLPKTAPSGCVEVMRGDAWARPIGITYLSAVKYEISSSWNMFCSLLKKQQTCAPHNWELSLFLIGGCPNIEKSQTNGHHSHHNTRLYHSNHRNTRCKKFKCFICGQSIFVCGSKYSCSSL